MRPTSTSAWFVVVGSGDPAVDDEPCAPTPLAARVWCVDAVRAARAAPRPCRATARRDHPRRHRHGRGPLPPATRSSPPTSPAPSTGCSPAAPLDLRRRAARPGPGWVALVGGGPGADGLLTEPRPRAARRRPTSWSSTGSRPAGVVDRLPSTVRVVDVGKAPGRHALAAGRDQRPARRGGARRPRRRAAQGRRPLRARARWRGAAGVRGARHPRRGRARRDERGRRAGGRRHPGHPPRRGARVHRRHRPRRAARGAARHRPHRRAAHGRRPARAVGTVAAGRPAARHPARSRSSSAASRPTSGSPSAPSPTSPSAPATVGVENPAVVVVGDVVRLSPDFPR